MFSASGSTGTASDATGSRLTSLLFPESNAFNLHAQFTQKRARRTISPFPWRGLLESDHGRHFCHG
jgi:hypothetical protein